MRTSLIKLPKHSSCPPCTRHPLTFKINFCFLCFNLNGNRNILILNVGLGWGLRQIQKFSNSSCRQFSRWWLSVCSVICSSRFTNGELLFAADCSTDCFQILTEQLKTWDSPKKSGDDEVFFCHFAACVNIMDSWYYNYYNTKCSEIEFELCPKNAVHHPFGKRVRVMGWEGRL